MFYVKKSLAPAGNTMFIKFIFCVVLDTEHENAIVCRTPVFPVTSLDNYSIEPKTYADQASGTN